MCIVSNQYVNISILSGAQFFTGKSKYRPSLWKFVSSFVMEVYFSEDLCPDRETVLSSRGSSLICGDDRINVLPCCPSVTYLKCAETYTVLNVATHKCYQQKNYAVLDLRVAFKLIFGSNSY